MSGSGGPFEDLFGQAMEEELADGFDMEEDGTRIRASVDAESKSVDVEVDSKKGHDETFDLFRKVMNGSWRKVRKHNEGIDDE